MKQLPPATTKEYPVFLWGWCEMCGAHITCPKCGNNSCNGTFGRLKNGKVCNVCNLAYQYCHLCYAHGIQPKNRKQIAEFNKKIRKDEGF